MSDSNIISIAAKRKAKKENALTQKYPLEKRVAELEADLLKVTEAVMDAQKRLDNQYNTIHKLLRLLKDQTFSSSYSRA